MYDPEKALQIDDAIARFRENFQRVIDVLKKANLVPADDNGVENISNALDLLCREYYEAEDESKKLHVKGQINDLLRDIKKFFDDLETLSRRN